MTRDKSDWQGKGFGEQPTWLLSGERGVLLYRCWGLRTRDVGSSEWGCNDKPVYFSLEKATSVMDAEMRFNIVDWDNGVNFVSTFRLKPGFHYWQGSVAHGELDHSLPGTQVIVEQPVRVKLELIKSKEVLRHDVIVGPKDGTVGPYKRIFNH